jgi:hypothetical protein
MGWYAGDSWGRMVGVPFGWLRWLGKAHLSEKRTR